MGFNHLSSVAGLASTRVTLIAPNITSGPEEFLLVCPGTPPQVATDLGGWPPLLTEQWLGTDQFTNSPNLLSPSLQLPVPPRPLG